eukprot:jgi/Mesvir1/17158/Mv07583-RA.1
MPPFSTPWFKLNKRTHLVHDTKAKALIWNTPQHPDVIITHFPPESLTHVGDKVVKRVRWMSGGGNQCPSELFEQKGSYCKGAMPCAHFSVQCLAGTGDFRIGLFDSRSHELGEKQLVRADGITESTRYGGINRVLRAEPFARYRGYHFRIYPHLSRYAEKYYDEEGGTGSHVPCSIYRKVEPDLFDKFRVHYPGSGCFELPLDTWGTLEISIERAGEQQFRVSLSMNGLGYTLLDDWAAGGAVSAEAEYMRYHKPLARSRRRAMVDSSLPEWIDTMAIQFPNGRRYKYVKLAEAPAGRDGADLDTAGGEPGPKMVDLNLRRKRELEQILRTEEDEERKQLIASWLSSTSAS